MSSCSNCGSCQQYMKGPSGDCDYCDCPYADHVQGAQSSPPVKQPSQQQGMQFGQQYLAPFQQQMQPMQPMPGAYQAIAPNLLPFNQQMGLFNPQPPPMQFYQPQFAGMPGMPIQPPNQMGHTGAQPQQPLCAKCKANPANPGFAWCQSCFEGSPNCRKCGKNPPNKGFRWCESCFQKEQPRNPIDCIPSELGSEGGCPACGNPKFYDRKKKKFFDFCGQPCATQHYDSYGVLKLENKHEDYVTVENKFKEKWNIAKGACPNISAIFKVNPKGTDAKFDKYLKNLRHENVNTIEYYFHGCKITCDLLKSNSLCARPDCTICLVSKQGFDITKVGTNVPFNRFGKGLYFAPESSKCHDYTLGHENYGYRAMFYVKCAPGFKQVLFVDNPQRTAPDKGYDSLYGLAGGNLNYDELCLYNDSACVPEYILVYTKDGVDRRCF